MILTLFFNVACFVCICFSANYSFWLFLPLPPLAAVADESGRLLQINWTEQTEHTLRACPSVAVSIAYVLYNVERKFNKQIPFDMRRTRRV